ncbi:acyltransferase family protein [Wenjunlia tyrosinilytica]|uniref:acyltransferase family protein n=1 Tax=Wenjunlia tyrosinilytica TaxID=1544741 RepID=UPI001667D112|nr:acyltransferase family protein [Wenjunlia tyrosinilytica]
MTAPAALSRAAVESPVPSARSRPAPARDPFLDNAKFLLVVLVVIGHNWGPLINEMRVVKAAYLFLYSFHMPAFVLLSGYFSRGFTGRPEQIRKLAATVLLPYLIFETAYTALFTLAWGRPFAITPTTPTYLCWFLLALFVWRITVPVWTAVRRPVAVSVVVSLASGTTFIHYDLALPRVLQFLPWFVIGLRMAPEHFRRLRRPAVRRFGVGAAATAAAGAWWIAPRASPNWMPMQYSHTELHVGLTQYLVVRAAMLVVSGALVVAFFAWVPRHRAAFTALGTVTMYPYLLHGLVVQAAQAYGLYSLAAWGGVFGAVMVTAGSAAFAVVLTSEPVRRATRWAVEPRSVLRALTGPLRRRGPGGFVPSPASEGLTEGTR